jgi:hypothetical protein
MSDDVTHRDITVDINDDDVSKSKGFPEAVKEIGDAIFKNYEDKTAYLSSENILGTIKCDLLNEFMETSYGIRFPILDLVVASVKSRRQSKDGYGKDKFIEALQKLQATFDLIEGTDANRRQMQRRF